ADLRVDVDLRVARVELVDEAVEDLLGGLVLAVPDDDRHRLAAGGRVVAARCDGLATPAGTTARRHAHQRHRGQDGRPRLHALHRDASWVEGSRSWSGRTTERVRLRGRSGSSPRASAAATAV